MHATITVLAKSWDESRDGVVDEQHAIARARFDTDWSGDVNGTSTCWLLISYVDGVETTPESLVGPFLGFELVRASVDGRTGTFVLAATGEHRDAAARTDVTIVEGSGTGGLEGISGSGSYTAGGMRWSLELDYELG